jgi:hypothetical protein
MLSKRRAAAQEIANRLMSAEEAIDAALSAVAELSGYLPVARCEAGLSAVVGQNAFEGTAETMAALVRARRHIVETHHSLAETKDQIGLRAVALGGLGQKASLNPGGLTVVENIAAA